MPTLLPLSCQPGLFVMPVGPLCHARRSPFVMPAGPPLSFPQSLAGIQCLFLLSLHSWGPVWKNHGCPIKNVGHDSGRLENVWHDSGPALPPLSCPPVPFVMPVGPLCYARWSTLLCPPGLFVMPAGPLCHSRGSSVIPAGTLCHSRRSPSVIPAGPPLSFPQVPLCHSRSF